MGFFENRIGYMSKGGKGAHWIGCESDHWDCAIRMLEKRLSLITTRIAELEADNEQRRLDYTESVTKLDAKIRELEQQLAAAQERERWIPVTELPRKPDNYLAFGKYFETAHELYFNGKIWRDEAGYEVEDVWFWRELPAPPEA